jgi:tetratricopeptide (TPR) repeat protein
MTSASSGGSLIGKIGSYLQIFAKDPSSTVFVPLAEAYRQIGLLDDALEAARIGTNMLPHFSPGFSTMGRILGQMGRLDEAMSAYAKALSIDRQSQAALIGLARLHLIRGERDQAHRILSQAREFHPEDEKIADMLIALDLPRPWSEIKQKSLKQEIPLQKQAVPGQSGEPILTATLAEVYVKQGLLDKAISVYTDILKLNPDNAAARERMIQLKGRLAEKVESPATAQDVELTPEVIVQEAVAPDELPETFAATPETENVPKDHSPMAVLQRWLTVVKQGRANVQ